MNQFLQDVHNQPEAMAQALTRYLSPEFTETFRRIAGLRRENIIFTGMGSSHFGSVPAALYLNRYGNQARVVSAGQLLHYGMNTINEDTLLVMVSQSGESAEIVALLERLEGTKATVIAITNEASSTLYRKSTAGLLMGVEREESVTTRTYLATLLLNHLLARVLVHGETGLDGKELSEGVAELSRMAAHAAPLLVEGEAFFAGVQFISCVGRGPSYGSAQAAGLFFKEVGKFPAEGMDSAEFRHGPLEMADERFGAIIFAPAGVTGDLSLKLAGDVAAKGAKVLLITNMEHVTGNKNMKVLSYGPVNEFVAPLVEIVGAQMICNVMAKRQGFVPGQFRWARKVTDEE